jgi:hypothetical protein
MRRAAHQDDSHAEPETESVRPPAPTEFTFGRLREAMKVASDFEKALVEIKAEIFARARSASDVTPLAKPTHQLHNMHKRVSKVLQRLKKRPVVAPLRRLLHRREKEWSLDGLQWVESEIWNRYDLSHEQIDKLTVKQVVEKLEARDAGAETPSQPVGNLEKPPAPPAPSPALVLGKPGDFPKIRGKTIHMWLSVPRHNVLTALLEVFPKSLNKDALIKKSGHKDAVNILKRLRKAGADWESAIDLPGQRGAGYRIATA